ncbi:eCIS core domain-containing protein [Aquimarina sediminis]|uniref:eCIS core domain-containing protein n=1 Tax=Aquimarina sediminis TaxID=2070536 RepID=UPI000CA00D50|nr:DUF4157 domain-containing protein [Aquimarina sediminis]
MKSVFSSRRNKVPHNNEGKENKEAPFFSKEAKKPFFSVSNGGAVQTKLSIGQPGDKYEKEADSMADTVVNKTAKPDIQNKEISSIQRESLATPQEDEKLGTAEQRMEEDKLVQEKPEIQRMENPEEEMVSKMEGDEEKEMINKMDEEQEDPKALQTKSDGTAQTASPKITQQLKSKSGKGNPLSKAMQTEMEASFGTDFSTVNIHTDQDAVDMNKELGAKAFTHGNDVYFNSGKYSPDTTEGKRLLAHELTHVVQQNNQLKRKKEIIQPYRSKKAFNFNTDPTDPKKKNTGALQEENFNKKKDKEKKPWIQKIYIHFDGYSVDDDGDWMPTGNLFAFYYPNSIKPMDWIPIPPFGVPFPIPKFISFPISGGKHNEGYTDSGKFTVTRIEGVGYNDMPYTKSDGGDLDRSKGEGPRQKYAKDLNSSMSYAIFFNGGQAIHSGGLDTGSHSCVHVDWGKGKSMGNTRELQQLNYHSVKGLTKVVVSYDPKILPKLCCDRLKHQGKKKGRGVNPCNKIKAETC